MSFKVTHTSQFKIPQHRISRLDYFPFKSQSPRVGLSKTHTQHWLLPLPLTTLNPLVSGRSPATVPGSNSVSGIYQLQPKKRHQPTKTNQPKQKKNHPQDTHLFCASLCYKHFCRKYHYFPSKNGKFTTFSYNVLNCLGSWRFLSSLERTPATKPVLISKQRNLNTSFT